MAAARRWKVYMGSEYRASTKLLVDAAIIVSGWGQGQVRDGHKRVLWNEGQEAVPAAESFDGAAEIMEHRANS